tara:strand:- start:2917 stop:3330 length:414 start_codon:yes stop_codon:yes gene_type:complete
MISHEKRQFLKVISGGLHILMSCSYKADDIGIDPEDGIEETISEKMIVLANTIANGERYWFDDGRFNNYVDVASDEDLIELLEYFDDIDMDMEHVYYEASIAIESLSDTNYKFASLIENEKLITFKDLINHDQSPCQ